MNLTMAGRAELVKFVVQGMLVYTMLIYKWPRRLLHKLDMFSKNFIYSGDGTKISLTTHQWKSTGKPKNEGGLGIQLLGEFNLVGLYRRAWELVLREKPWTSFVAARFMKNGRVLNYYKSSSIWSGLKFTVEALKQDLAWIICPTSKCSLWFNDWTLRGSLISKTQIPPQLEYTR